jgi:hypothetical protein
MPDVAPEKARNLAADVNGVRLRDLVGRDGKFGALLAVCLDRKRGLETRKAH